jgi:hypothetical protein
MAEAMQGGVMSLPPEMGGMAQPPQSYLTPEDEATLTQLRNSVSPQEFNQEMFNAAEQMDPQAIAQLRSMLQGMRLPQELIDLMKEMVSSLLQEPAKYAENRQQLIAEGVPEDLLPPEFDPNYLMALDMALDQVSEPVIQGFAAGGFVQNPISAGIASLGRNGDTMLAHITPREARMLQRAGGAGTINPVTGLPEFFLGGLAKAIGGAFRSVGKAVSGVLTGIGKAVKSFASSTVGRMVTSVALGFFLGPAAAGLLGVTSAAGVAAISGFIGGAGSTLLAGGSIKDALKTGAIGGLTAGAFSGVSGGAGAFKAGTYTGPTTISESWKGFTEKLGTRPAADAAKAVAGGVDEAAAAAPPPPAIESAVQSLDELKLDAISGRTAAVPQPSIQVTSPTGQAVAGPAVGPSKFDVISRGSPPAVSPAPPAPAPAPTNYLMNPPLGAVKPDPLVQKLTANLPADTASTSGGVMDLLKQGEIRQAATKAGEGIKGLYDEYLSPSNIEKAGAEKAMTEATKAVNALPAGTSEAVKGAVFNKVYESNLPGMLATYGPLAAAGIGATYLAGGFDVKPPPKPEIPVSGTELYKRNPYLLTPQIRTISASTGQPYRMAAGGIASLAQGSTKYPRKTGPIDGPGTGTSDSIPAMLSDGEFVFTAKAVRGMGKGSRRKGAKRMYALMKALEKRA